MCGFHGTFPGKGGRLNLGCWKIERKNVQEKSKLASPYPICPEYFPVQPVVYWSLLSFAIRSQNLGREGDPVRESYLHKVPVRESYLHTGSRQRAELRAEGSHSLARLLLTLAL